MLQIEFDEATHTYRVNGQKWPGVTEILRPLQDFSGVDPTVLKRAQDFGIALHKACELDANGTLDESTLDPQLAPWLEQFRAFLYDTRWKVLGTEEMVGHDGLKYCGKYDLRMLTNSGRHAIVDIKSGAKSKTVGFQTEAYARARCAMHEEKIRYERYALYLRATEYRLVPCRNSDDDWRMFLSCHSIHYWKQENTHVRESARAA